jgi:hypothetical protein
MTVNPTCNAFGEDCNAAKQAVFVTFPTGKMLKPARKDLLQIREKGCKKICVNCR